MKDEYKLAAWIKRAWAEGTEFAQLGDASEFPTLDTKIAAGMITMIEAANHSSAVQLRQNIQMRTQEALAKNRILRGAQILFLFMRWHRTTGNTEHLLEWKHLSNLDAPRNMKEPA